MNDRERFVAYLTGEPVDRPPYWLFWGPWQTTLARWEREGKPADGEAMARGETPLGAVRGTARLTRLLLSLLEPAVGPEPTAADLLVEDGSDLRDLGLDATVLHTPGHTPGSTCLLVGGRIAFAGDLLSTTVRPHAQHLYASDWAQIPRSLARLQAARPAWICPGHGNGPMRGAALARLVAGAHR